MGKERKGREREQPKKKGRGEQGLK